LDEVFLVALNLLQFEQIWEELDAVYWVVWRNFYEFLDVVVLSRSNALRFYVFA